MTQEEKELLLKDLCARLPYKCKISFTSPLNYNTIIVTLKGIELKDNKILAILLDENILVNVEYIKPYLRPISSMTEEEMEEYDSFFNTDYGYMDAGLVFDVADWVNSHHFDYRGLIEKGLAIDCTELNIY